MSRAIGDHPAYVVVDSVSGLGASEFKMDEWKLDIVCAASQKALACPPGLAMIAVSPRAWDKIKANKAPRFYFDLQKHKISIKASHHGRHRSQSLLHSTLQSIFTKGKDPEMPGPGTHATPTRFMKLLRRLGWRSFHVMACIP